MVAIRSFRALRPPTALAERVASVPYDTVDTVEARALAEGCPESFLRVVRAELEFPADADSHSDEVYAHAGKRLRDHVKRGWLVREEQPSLYVYRLTWRGRSQTGLVVCCSADDYLEDRIKKHEKTRPDKEEDRMRLTLALRAHTGPVFLTYRDHGLVDALVSEALRQAPVFDFTAPDEVRHEGWRIDAPEALIEAFAGIDALYVADGHHRSASAARTAVRLREQGDPGADEAAGFLAVLFPASQLRVLPYNRLVNDLHGLDPEAFRARVEESFEWLDDARDEPPQRGQIQMYLQSRWWGLRPRGAAPQDPVARLDVSRLQDGLLGPVLGIDDPRTSERIRFVGGIRGSAALARAVDAGEAAVAFALYPVAVEEIMQVADAGRIMAPKCTWFEPKLRSGLFVHEF